MEAIRHSIRPRIIHTFIPDVDQDDLPNFDSIDRIDNENLLTYSLVNTLTSKTRKKGTFDISRISKRADRDRTEIVDAPVEYSYTDFLRFELEQNYDINEAMEKDPEKPFSPIDARLDFFPGKYVGFDATALWSVYENKFLSHNIGGSIWDSRGDRLYVEYRYTRESDEIDLNPAQSIFGDLRLKVTDRLRVSGLYEYNFQDNTRVRTGFGLTYKADCWQFDGRIVDKVNVGDRNDVNWEFNIKLFGLGEFGI